MADASTTPQNGGGASSGAAAKKSSTKSNRDLHVGHFALNYRRDNMEVVSPFNNKTGLYEDWDLLENIWQYVLSTLSLSLSLPIRSEK